MRLTITPIGAVGASTARVAADVVDYLEGARGDPGAALLAGGGGAAAYYADSREGPGRWLGAGPPFSVLRGRWTAIPSSACSTGDTRSPVPAW